MPGSDGSQGALGVPGIRSSEPFTPLAFYFYGFARHIPLAAGM